MPGLVEALTTGRLLSRLSREVQRDMLELFTKSAREFLGQWFESARQSKPVSLDRETIEAIAQAVAMRLAARRRAAR